MADSCTCGAQLPPDALFCHKCGKPQRDIIPEAREEVVQPPLPEAYAPPPAYLESMATPRLSFRDPVAVRIALLLAPLTMFALMLQKLFLLWPFAAGFLAAWLYRRRTGRSLTVLAGARLGWITSVLSFTLLSVVITIFFAAVVWGGADNYLLTQLHAVQQPDNEMKLMIDMLQNPKTMATMILQGLATLFVSMTVLSVAGGALSAKLANR